MAVTINIRALATPIGELLLSSGDSGVTGIEFDSGDPERTRAELLGRLSKRFGKELELVESSAALDSLALWLERFFADPLAAGQFASPLDPGGSAFQRAVWKVIADIPAGQVLTYGQIAAAIGNPGAVRAVGSACGANPIPLAVPCHRVVASGGPGGFGGGLELKRKLLAREGYSLA
jgi:AraC family transcriptional regulator of adaptative response/methylated-DNA-[protein]-cysteine methyltransferase